MTLSSGLYRKLFETLGSDAGSELTRVIERVDLACRPELRDSAARSIQEAEAELRRQLNELRREVADRHDDLMRWVLTLFVVGVINLFAIMLVFDKMS